MEKEKKWDKKYDEKYKRVNLRFTHEEYKTILEISSKIGITPTEYCQNVSLDYRSKLLPRPSVTDADSLKQIRKMGVNFNQITKLANQKKELDGTILAELRLIRNLYGQLIKSLS